jgi:O-antigen/teichoic acid export membrane protein
VVLSLTFLVHVPGHVAGVYLLGTGDHKVLALISVGAAALNLVLSVALALWMGLVGVALATGISFLVALGVLIPAHTLRRTGLSVGRYLATLAGPVLTGTAVWGIGALLLPKGEVSLGLLLLMIAGIFVGFFAVYVTMGMTRGDRGRYLRALRRALGREVPKCDSP